MTLTDTQLAEIRAKAEMYPRQYHHGDVMALLDHIDGLRVALSFTDQLNALCAEQLDSIASLESQLSTIRKEATDAERERCALIADDFERTAESFGGAHAKIAEGTAWGIAQAIRAPTGDEGK